MRVQGAIDLLRARLGLHQDVGHSLAKLGLATRVEFHGSSSDRGTRGRSTTLPVRAEGRSSVKRLSVGVEGEETHA